MKALICDQCRELIKGCAVHITLSEPNRFGHIDERESYDEGDLHPYCSTDWRKAHTRNFEPVQ